MEDIKLYYDDLHINPDIIYSENVIKRDYRIYSFLCWNSDQEYIYPYDFICEKINTNYKEVIKNYFKIYKF